MTPLVILGAITLAPILILMLLRVNAALVFLSVCLGSVLMRFLGPDTGTALSLFSAHSPHGVTASRSTAELVLLLLPVVVTIVFMVKTVPKGLKLAFNLLPAAGVGLLLALFAVPLLPDATATSITTSNAWVQAVRAQDLIVGLSALICMLALLSLRPKHEHAEKHGKKH